ncbi:MAG: transglycosylase SLT domain-containing protein [Gemmatimonadaceae bacterium]|nr:transglycosylase SLT domain-containing protein [Gemmatimonadaceae bacterium]
MRSAHLRRGVTALTALMLSAPLGAQAPARPVVPVEPRRDSVPRLEAGALAREALRVFGDSVAPRVDSLLPPGEPVWDIDVRSFETHDRVERYVDIFSRRAKGTFAQALSRQTRYAPLISERLRAGGLPEDIAYLALIESWFDPDAYSRAAAVGMWQFMTRTARGVGLRVDWWVDERRDPVRATEGAVRYLSALQKQFGSLYLAAAAYNGGDGRVARGLRRFADDVTDATSEERFFVLAENNAFRPETRDYVPKIIAAALVGKEPLRYGIAVDTLAPFVFDSIRVGGETALDAIAEAAVTDLAELRTLNPALLRGMTPIGDSMIVRVPFGTGADAARTLAAMPEARTRALRTVRTKKGQGLAGVARAHGITATQLGWYNRALAARKKALPVGTAVLVPTKEVVRAARVVPDPAKEIYGRRRAPVRVTTVTVRRGESLSAIAKRSGVSVATLRRLNGIRGDRVLAGQKLRTRSVAPVKKAAVKQAAAKKPVAKKVVAKKPAAKKPVPRPQAR